MSNNATGWETVPPDQAWPREQRLKMMREVVERLANEGCLRPGFAPAIARTYGVSIADVEAEMMRHLSEGEGK